jgi:hypothetical protein
MDRNERDRVDGLLKDGLAMMPAKREAVNQTISHVRFVAWCEGASGSWFGSLWMPLTASVFLALVIGVLFFGQPVTRALQVVHTTLTGGPVAQEQVMGDFSGIPQPTYEKVKNEFSRFYEEMNPSPVARADSAADTIATAAPEQSAIHREFLAFRDRILQLLSGQGSQKPGMENY